MLWLFIVVVIFFLAIFRETLVFLDSKVKLDPKESLWVEQFISLIIDQYKKHALTTRDIF